MILCINIISECSKSPQKPVALMSSQARSESSFSSAVQKCATPVRFAPSVQPVPLHKLEIVLRVNSCIGTSVIEDRTTSNFSLFFCRRRSIFICPVLPPPINSTQLSVWPTYLPIWPTLFIINPHNFRKQSPRTIAEISVRRAGGTFLEIAYLFDNIWNKLPGKSVSVR